MRVLWTARILNQSILKEISPEYSLGRLMLKLMLQSLWTPNVKSLTGKDSDAAKHWEQEKEATKDKMV